MSGKAVRKANELKISQVGDFKKRIGGIFELPSGMVVRLRNPGGLAAFSGTDTIPNSLMSIVSQGLESNKKGIDQAKLLEQIKEDPETIHQMSKMIDGIALRTIVEPRVHPAPTNDDLLVWNQENPEMTHSHPDDLRDDELLYVDEVPTTDKQFIFQWITSGVADLATFRKQLEQSVAELS